MKDFITKGAEVYWLDPAHEASGIYEVVNVELPIEDDSVILLCSGEPGKENYSEVETTPNEVFRPLYKIAEDIRSNWKKIYFGAVPYLEAMETLNGMDDKFICDDADEIVMYFLANAQTWRGEVARRVKKELNAMLK